MATCALLTLVCANACTLRYARGSFRDEVLQESRRGVPVEGGVTLFHQQRSFGRVDVSLMGSHQSFDLFTDAAVTTAGVTVRLTPRPSGTIQPFVGAGLGMYRLASIEEKQFCGHSSICVDAGFTGRGGDIRRGATGLNPHWTAGLEILPGGRPYGVVAGITHQFMTSAAQWELDSFRFSAGLVYRPR